MEKEDPRTGEPKKWAAGLPAVASSMTHILREAGPLRGAKGLQKMNQHGGFDCPSCAWPDPDGDRSFAEFCENGAKALASESTRNRADREFFAKHTLADLKAREDIWHEKQGRISEPMLLREGASHYEPVSWQEAFSVIAEKLDSLGTPNEAVFYTSGRASNEAAFVYQLFARSFGTNNLPDCSNMCHESSGLALKQSIGVGKGTVTMDDFLEADTILCVGQNPGTNHPRMLTTLEEAVRSGARIVAINPLQEAGLTAFAHPQKVSGLLGISTRLASRFVQVRVNGDMALFRGIAKTLIENGMEEMDFIARHTANYGAYRNLVTATNWDEITGKSGVPRDQIESLADALLRGERKVVTCWAMGLTQHRNSVATIREVANVHLLLGAIGRQGAGLCPVRGHSNVQGDRTMGIWEKMPDDFLCALDREFGIVSPRKEGFDTVASIHAMHEGRAKVFLALGGNFLQASPDTAYTGTALSNCDLTCHVSTKLNRSHLVTGKTALILPCLGRSERDGDERFVTCENSMGIVQSSSGILEPASKHLKSEVEIICGIAEALFGAKHEVPWAKFSEDYGQIRKRIERIVPGFDDYSRRSQEPGGFYLPNAAKERIWETPEARAVFGLEPLSVFEPKKGRLVLQTLRSHDQFNTTIYGNNDRYRGIANGRRVLMANPEDLASRGIGPGAKVDITSYWDDGERVAENFTAIPYEMPRGCAAAYFPEANVLVPATAQAEGGNAREQVYRDRCQVPELTSVAGGTHRMDLGFPVRVAPPDPSFPQLAFDFLRCQIGTGDEEESDHRREENAKCERDGHRNEELRLERAIEQKRHQTCEGGGGCEKDGTKTAGIRKRSPLQRRFRQPASSG